MSIRQLSFLLLLLSQHLCAQQVLRCYGRLVDINVVCEYFYDTDSSFAAKNNISEIILYESFLKDSVPQYERPIIVYRYNDVGKRIHTESNFWVDSLYYRSDVQDDYGDSIISVHVEQTKASQYNKYGVSHKTRYAFIWHNDSVLQRNSYTYRNDSLISTEDLGIYNSKEEARKLAQAKSRAVAIVDSSSPPKLRRHYEPNIQEHLEPDEYSAKPQDTIFIKDSLGRITQIETFELRTLHNIRGSFPENTFTIEYLDSTKIIQRLRAYKNYDEAYFNNMVKHDTTGAWQHQWQPGKIYNDIYFECKASYFVCGIPRLVVISDGKDFKNVRMYKTMIRRR